MLDTTDRFVLKQVSVVSFGANAGPHNLVLSADDSRLVVTDYFLNEDDAGIIHFEGDHKVHVLKVTHDTLIEDQRFKLDFNTAFKTGPARPHGIAMKELLSAPPGRHSAFFCKLRAMVRRIASESRSSCDGQIVRIEAKRQNWHRRQN